MFPLNHKKTLVLGLGVSGLGACELLLQEGAKVVAVDPETSPLLKNRADRLEALGVKVYLGCKTLPRDKFDLAILSPGVHRSHPFIRSLTRRKVPYISQLELGYQCCYTLNVAVTGTNGKTTTTGLIQKVLSESQVKTLMAGNNDIPICAVAKKTKDLDVLVLETHAFELENIKFFRPAVAVMLNVTPDHTDRYPRIEDYIRAKARIFINQQAFDWAIIQSEVLAQLQILGIPIPSKVITFSANNRRADLYLDRGLLISRMEGWAGPLLNMDDCQLRGPHNAENLMAALAVGRVMRVSLDSMLDPLKSFTPPRHRCEKVATIKGVTFINDAKSTNVDSLQKALLALPFGQGGEPNVWLIAGGRGKSSGYHDVGPTLSERVKGAFLLGETREKLRAAWSLFTPCTLVDSLLEAIHESARNAKDGDIVLLSPACSSLDQFSSYQHRGETFCEAVKKLAGKGLKKS